MTQPPNTMELGPTEPVSFSQRALRHPATHLLCSAGILMLDLVTGPFLQFPILFVLPVAAAAWHVGSRLAYSLAVVLPVGRLAVAWLIDQPSPTAYIVVNCLIRIMVLLFIAYLVRRIVRRAQMLEGRLDSLVTVCAWSRTVEYEGEWLSFEEYLRRRFKVQVSHGISPEESARLKKSPDALQSGLELTQAAPDVSRLESTTPGDRGQVAVMASSPAPECGTGR